jgi:hypothetical protein
MSKREEKNIEKYTSGGIAWGNSETPEIGEIVIRQRLVKSKY